MKKKKKMIFPIAVIVVLLLVIFILMYQKVIPLPAFLRSQNEDDRLTKAVRIINDGPTDILLYGDDIAFADGITYRKIEQLTEDSLEKLENSKYSYLIINDLNNAVNLSDSEISLLYDYINTKHYPVIYFGDKYLSVWDNTQFIADVEGSRCVAYQYGDGCVIRIAGLWSANEDEIYAEYPNLLGDVIVYQIESYIRENN